MATFSVPDHVPPVAEDCEKLRKAMQGHYLHCINPARSHMQMHIYISNINQQLIGIIIGIVMVKYHMQSCSCG